MKTKVELDKVDQANDLTARYTHADYLTDLKQDLKKVRTIPDTPIEGIIILDYPFVEDAVKKKFEKKPLLAIGIENPGWTSFSKAMLKGTHPLDQDRNTAVVEVTYRAFGNKEELHVTFLQSKNSNPKKMMQKLAKAYKPAKYITFAFEGIPLSGEEEEFIETVHENKPGIFEKHVETDSLEAIEKGIAKYRETRDIFQRAEVAEQIVKNANTWLQHFAKKTKPSEKDKTKKVEVEIILEKFQTFLKKVELETAAAKNASKGDDQESMIALYEVVKRGLQRYQQAKGKVPIDEQREELQLLVANIDKWQELHKKIDLNTLPLDKKQLEEKRRIAVQGYEDEVRNALSTVESAYEDFAKLQPLYDELLLNERILDRLPQDKHAEKLKRILAIKNTMDELVKLSAPYRVTTTN